MTESLRALGFMLCVFVALMLVVAPGRSTSVSSTEAPKERVVRALLARLASRVKSAPQNPASLTRLGAEMRSAAAPEHVYIHCVGISDPKIALIFDGQTSTKTQPIVDLQDGCVSSRGTWTTRFTARVEHDKYVFVDCVEKPPIENDNARVPVLGEYVFADQAKGGAKWSLFVQPTEVYAMMDSQRVEPIAVVSGVSSTTVHFVDFNVTVHQDGGQSATEILVYKHAVVTDLQGDAVSSPIPCAGAQLLVSGTRAVTLSDGRVQMNGAVLQLDKRRRHSFVTKF